MSKTTEIELKKNKIVVSHKSIVKNQIVHLEFIPINKYQLICNKITIENKNLQYRDFLSISQFTNALDYVVANFKNQDKIVEMVEIINEGLDNNLINEKWELQKKLLSALIAKNKEEIDIYRKKINQGLDEIISSNKNLDYDNDQIIVPPHVELSYSDWDNLDLNKKTYRHLKNCTKF